MYIGYGSVKCVWCGRDNSDQCCWLSNQVREIHRAVKSFLILATCLLSLNVHDNRHFSFRLSHHEFLQRYSLALKHLNPVTRSHVTLPQARSPKKAEASPRVSAVERLKRRSRRRHRSSYDHKRHICRSILEVVQVDSDDVKENLHTNDSDGVKIGRTKVFLREEAVG